MGKKKISRILVIFKDENGHLDLSNSFWPSYCKSLTEDMNRVYDGKYINYLNITFNNEEYYVKYPVVRKFYVHNKGGVLEFNGLIDYNHLNSLSLDLQEFYIRKMIYEDLKFCALTTKNPNLLSSVEQVFMNEIANNFNGYPGDVPIPTVVKSDRIIEKSLSNHIIKNVNIGDCFVINKAVNNYYVLICSAKHTNIRAICFEFFAIDRVFTEIPLLEEIDEETFIGKTSYYDPNSMPQTQIELDTIWNIYPELKPKEILGPYATFISRKEFMQMRDSFTFIGNRNLIKNLYFVVNTGYRSVDAESIFSFIDNTVPNTRNFFKPLKLQALIVNEGVEKE